MPHRCGADDGELRGWFRADLPVYLHACGFFNDRSRDCRCTQPMIQRYMQKISGPLMDRIDIHIDVPAVNYKEMRAGVEPEGSAQIRERIVRAREIQLQRLRTSEGPVGPGSSSTRQESVRAARTY